LALPNSLTAHRAQPPHPASKADFFTEAVHDAVDRVGLQCPDVLVGITFGIEDVPHFDIVWSGDQVPLAAALEGTANQPSQVVVYRRPLEHRAVSRRGLRILVYRTIVEQLAALTGRSVEEIDPDGAGADDDYPPWFCITRERPSSESEVSDRNRDEFSVECVENRADEDLRVIAQHCPCETENAPALSHERVLAPAVGLEQVHVGFMQPSINLDRQLLLLECDVDVIRLTVHMRRQVGFPTRDPCGTQQPMTQAFRGRPGLVT